VVVNMLSTPKLIELSLEENFESDKETGEPEEEEEDKHVL